MSVCVVFTNIDEVNKPNFPCCRSSVQRKNFDSKYSSRSWFTFHCFVVLKYVLLQTKAVNYDLVFASFLLSW